MKWKLFFLGIILSPNMSFAKLQLVDKIVAIVNNDVILKSDVDNLIQFEKENEELRDYQKKNTSVVRHKILERLIMDQIIIQIGKKRGIEITDEQLERSIVDIAKQYNMTINQLRSSLSQKRVSYTFYRDKIRKEMLISKVSNEEIGHRVVILPQEVEILAEKIENQNDILNELNLSYIIVPIPKYPTPAQVLEAKSKAYLIAELARNGKHFNKLVIDYSTNQIKLNSSCKEWIYMRDLPAVFYQELRTAKKGDIVGPILFGKNFHILRVNALRNHSKNTFITEVNVRHIFLKPSSVISDDQTRKKLEQIAKDIKNGKITFSKAAKEFSQDFSSSKNDGELGWIVLDTCDPSLRNVLMQLNKNQVSAPVRSSFGWHLIELLDIRNKNKIDSIKEEIAYRILYEKKFSEEAIIWMREQRANAYVKILRSS